MSSPQTRFGMIVPQYGIPRPDGRANSLIPSNEPFGASWVNEFRERLYGLLRDPQVMAYTAFTSITKREAGLLGANVNSALETYTKSLEAIGSDIEGKRMHDEIIRVAAAINGKQAKNTQQGTLTPSGDGNEDKVKLYTETPAFALHLVNPDIPDPKSMSFTEYVEFLAKYGKPSDTVLAMWREAAKPRKTGNAAWSLSTLFSGILPDDSDYRMEMRHGLWVTMRTMGYQIEPPRGEDDEELLKLIAKYSTAIGAAAGASHMMPASSRGLYSDHQTAVLKAGLAAHIHEFARQASIPKSANMEKIEFAPLVLSGTWGRPGFN